MTDHGRNHADTALDERVSALLSAAAAPSEPGPLPGEGAALAAYRASLTPTRRRSVISSFLKARTGLAAAVGAGVLLTGGVTTAAAAGALPGAAQDTASDVLARFNIEVPGAAAAADGNADTRGGSADARADEPARDADEVAPTTDETETEASDGDAAAGSADAAAGNSGKGEEVAGLATSMEGGPEKGAVISGVASDGKSQAGQKGEDDASGEARRPEGAGSASEDGRATADAARTTAGSDAGEESGDDADDADEAKPADEAADADADAASADRRQDSSRP